MTPRATTGAFSHVGECGDEKDNHHDSSPHRRWTSTAGVRSSSLAAFAQRVALPTNAVVPVTFSPTRAFAAAAASSASSSPPERPNRSSPSPSPPEKEERKKQNETNLDDSFSFSVQPWSREDVMTVPNYISMSRGAFGPVLGAAYVADAISPTLMLLGVAAAALSDWADGYVARRLHLQSVAGTYLDPLGDKIFVASVSLALAAKGAIPLWLAGSMVTRDGALIAGAWVQRGRALGWRWDSWGQFFAGTRGARFGDDVVRNDENEKIQKHKREGAARLAPAVPPMRPELLGKFTTATQFALFGGAIAHGAFGWPSAEAMRFAYIAAGAATFASGASYFLRKDAFARPGPSA